MAKTTKKQELTYAEAMSEVEQILARFNNRQMDVDTLSAEVKRATELIAQCKQRLARAEKEVAEVLGSNEEGTR
ncbi:MAG: exodeoxyribonuclease VII small subunit [Rikenellaceae bacterium]|jgi:exodeoxyribonuclease VII small subunit|nr:exodeoxyribonuclease VII small subunit [Rikenellaceae bacterium]